MREKKVADEANAQSFLRDQLREMTGILEEFDSKYERKDAQLREVRQELARVQGENQDLRVNYEAAMHDLDRAGQAIDENERRHRDDVIRV